jgi:hypothetical protein
MVQRNETRRLHRAEGISIRSISERVGMVSETVTVVPRGKEPLCTHKQSGPLGAPPGCCHLTEMGVTRLHFDIQVAVEALSHLRSATDLVRCPALAKTHPSDNCHGRLRIEHGVNYLGSLHCLPRHGAGETRYLCRPIPESPLGPG